MTNSNKTNAHLMFALALAFLAALTLAGCAGSSTSESTGEFIDDTAITAAVKASLADRLGADSVIDISVETFKGVVALGGFVDSASERELATVTTAGVKGVRRVENGLAVK